jgi:hypothetical protein
MQYDVVSIDDDDDNDNDNDNNNIIYLYRLLDFIFMSIQRKEKKKLMQKLKKKIYLDQQLVTERGKSIDINNK